MTKDFDCKMYAKGWRSYPWKIILVNFQNPSKKKTDMGKRVGGETSTSIPRTTPLISSVKTVTTNVQATRTVHTTWPNLSRPPTFPKCNAD